jgi:hypothetical protein
MEMAIPAGGLTGWHLAIGTREKAVGKKPLVLFPKHLERLQYWRTGGRL